MLVDLRPVKFFLHFIHDKDELLFQLRQRMIVFV